MGQPDTVNQLPDHARFDVIEILLSLKHPLFGTYCLQMRLKESPSTCFGIKCYTHLLKCQK